MSSDPAPIIGQFADGDTAQIHTVTVAVEDDRLALTGDSLRLYWRIKRLRRLPDRPDGSVVISEDQSDARLSLDPDNAARLRPLLPKLLDDRKIRRGTWMLGGSLTALAAGLAGFMVYGLPLLSTPLAHAVPLDVEARLGARSNQFVAWFTDECETPEAAQAALDSLGDRLETVSQSPFELKLRIVDAPFPNAFALPGGWIVVTDDLIDMMESPDELAGVLAHEAAHVAQRHVMAAQLREMGAGVLLEFLIGGGTGAGQEIARTGATLESLRHSRAAEAEADDYALAYLEAADMNPEALADFFDRMQSVFEELEAEAEDEEDAAEDDSVRSHQERAEDWLRATLRTHPDTTRRADTAREAAAGLSWSGAAVMSDEDWAALDAVCETGVRINDTAMERAADRIADVLSQPGKDEDEAVSDEVDAQPGEEQE
ncbi:M48 family metallopeptidase [Maricaulis parjimensis]|uniref:M48 family metallopeptidase n=1 Tax=Maricaulis parjimensis TaxID=144023 RepID=UPI001939FFDF|nr:M48 family metallopeptidase [Maricaulis parjimensis]